MYQEIETYSLYIHIPFCRNNRCHYCDFNTYASVEDLIPSYIDSLVKEMFLLSQSSTSIPKIKTIYIGGGTPSILPVNQVKRILTAVNNNFDIICDCEVTIENNPVTIKPDYFHELRQIGVNRLSFGMQSAIPFELRLLGRQHDHYDMIQALYLAREANFDNISLDLIYGIPGQNIENWQQSITCALALKPEHLSLYSLSLEPGTQLYQWVMQGKVNPPDDDLAADMYEWVTDRLDAAGFQQYEISNWARRSNFHPHLTYSCQHNLQYWHNQPYIGIGAGAHGYAHDIRIVNFSSIQKYIHAIQTFSGEIVFPISPAAHHYTPVTRSHEIEETMMVGLRLTEEGISRDQFHRRFSCDIESIYDKPIRQMIKAGLLSWSGDNHDQLRLTRRGRILGNQVFMAFLLDTP